MFNFATSGSNGGGTVIFALIGLIWWPSHKFFKWVKKKHKTTLTTGLCLVGCVVLSTGIVFILMSWGYANPAIGRLGSDIDGNMMWLPALFACAGLWAGFLSGYTNMPAWPDEVKKKR